MKYYIAHRGNINGKDKERENSPSYIMEAIEKGFDVELDVWVINKCIFLGHDEPQYKVKKSFLFHKKMWCHAKNLEALTMLTKNNIHCFFNNSDDYVLTSKGIIWAYTGKEINEETICVMPENSTFYKKEELENCLGICSDMISKYKPLKKI